MKTYPLISFMNLVSLLAKKFGVVSISRHGLQWLCHLADVSGKSPLFYHPPTTSYKFTLDINVYRFFCPRKGWLFYDILICFLHGGLHSYMILLFRCWVDGSPSDFPKPLRSSSASATYSARHPRTSQSSVTSRSRSLSSGWIKMMIPRITKVKQ